MVPDCASAQWRRRWFIVGAFTRSLGGRVVAVSLWFCACIFRGFELVLSSMAVTVWLPLMLFACWSAPYSGPVVARPISRMATERFGTALCLLCASPARCRFCSAKKTELGSLASGHGVGRGLRLSLMGSPVDGDL